MGGRLRQAEVTAEWFVSPCLRSNHNLQGNPENRRVPNAVLKDPQPGRLTVPKHLKQITWGCRIVMSWTWCAGTAEKLFLRKLQGTAVAEHPVSKAAVNLVAERSFATAHFQGFCSILSTGYSLFALNNKVYVFNHVQWECVQYKMPVPLVWFSATHLN